jgi:hypothetical protein
MILYNNRKHALNQEKFEDTKMGNQESVH